MVKQQKIVLCIGISVIFLMGLFPPWSSYWEYDIQGRGKYSERFEVKYSFILNPPELDYELLRVIQGTLTPFRVDTGRLIGQWFITAIITSVLFKSVLYRKKYILNKILEAFAFISAYFFILIVGSLFMLLFYSIVYFPLKFRIGKIIFGLILAILLIYLAVGDFSKRRR